MNLEIPNKEHHPCWHSWDEALKPGQRMLTLLAQFVPDIHQLQYMLEDTIQYAVELENHLEWAYRQFQDHHLALQQDAERLDEIRAILKERVPEPDKNLFSEGEDDVQDGADEPVFAGL